MTPRGFVKVAFAVVLSASAFVAAAQSALPTPASVFGFEPGDDNMLATYEQVLDYYRRVDAASDRVMLMDAGETSQGRRMYFALVSSPGNLLNIDRLREIQQRLAHPDGLLEDEARALAREGRAFVHIDGGLHSTEVAPPQHTPLLLHNLLSRAAEPDVAAMLDDVVLMLWPTINPDGHQMVAERQARVNAGDDAPLAGLYQEYVGHDNNRDAYMLNMVESRTLEHTWRLWEPNIIYVHHQSSPFPTRIWLPPFAEPIATHAPYLTSREVNMIGMAIAKMLEERGQVGATHKGTGYDAWYPGYIDYLPIFKNIAAFWTETFGRGASPMTTAPEDIPEDMRRPQSLYVSPWPGGTWRLRDAVDYMETASWSVIDYASRYKDVLLMNRYRAGIDQIARGRSGPPYAYVIPQAQRDPVAAVELLRRLAFAGVRVYQYREESTVNGIRYPGGTWVVPTDQEYAALVRELLDVQEYPEIRASRESPLDQPYDAAGWTLGLAMGVEVVVADWRINNEGLVAVTDAAPIEADVTPYDSSSVADAAPFDSVTGLGFDSHPAARAIVPPAGRVAGSGPALAVNPAENNAFKAVNRAWAEGASVTFVAGTGPDDSRYVIAGLAPRAQEAMVREFALRAERRAAPASTGSRPRIGLWDVPTSMDQGWMRWVLERYGFEFVPVSGADLEAGALRETVDVLLVTDEPSGVLGRGGRGGGAGRGGGPPADNDARSATRREFVRGGGTVVAFNRAGNSMIDVFDLPVTNVAGGVDRREFAVNGSLLRVTTEPSRQVMAGMPREAAVFYDNGPVFEVGESAEGVAVIARYQDEGSPLLSGFILGEELLHGKAAAVDVRLGDGHVVLLGFRPQWRGQTFGTFRVIFNALLRGTARD